MPAAPPALNSRGGAKVELPGGEYRGQHVGSGFALRVLVAGQGSGGEGMTGIPDAVAHSV